MKALLPIADENVHHSAPVSTDQGTRTTTLTTQIKCAILDTREVHDVQGQTSAHLTLRFEHYGEIKTLRFGADKSVAQVLKQLREACQPKWKEIEV